MRKKVAVFLIFGTLLTACGHANNSADTKENEYTSASVAEENYDTKIIESEATENYETEISEAETAELPESQEPEQTETLVCGGKLDLADARYYGNYGGGFADFDSLTLARKTSGEYCIGFLRDYSNYGTGYEVVKKGAAFRSDNADLTVTEAGCQLFNNYNHFNNQYLYCSGDITLSGILRYRESDELLGSEVGAKGDIFFYPFPESISDLPVILPYYYARIRDDDNDFYMVSDTIELLLGNTESNNVYTRIEEISDAVLPYADIKYCEEIEEHLPEPGYYYATIKFSDLFLLSYQDRMTGHPYSSGNISEIISITPYS